MHTGPDRPGYPGRSGLFARYKLLDLMMQNSDFRAGRVNWRAGQVLSIHLGAHKTASTHLQQALRARRAALDAAGVACLGPAELRKGPLALGAVARGDGPVVEGKLRQALSARLQPGRRLLLSDENLLGPLLPKGHMPVEQLYPQADARLSRILRATGQEDATVFLALRDPAGFLVSSYSQRLMSGRLLPFRDFLAGRDLAQVRWSELVGRLAAVPGVARLVVWRFEDYPAVAPQVLAEMLPPELAAQVRLAEGRVNQGLSQVAHDALMRGKPGLTVMQVRALAATLRKEFPKSPDAPGFMPVSAEDLARSHAAYAADMARVAAMPAVRYLIPETAGARAERG